MNTRCIFCRIARKEAPAEILLETERSIAILDIRPIHFGHALVVPKAHSRDLLEVSPVDLQDIMHTTQRVARALVASLGLEGFNVFANNGRIAGQSVFHFHMHVTPRYARDNIRFVLDLKEYPEGLMQETAQKIRSAIE